jgi:carbonic anhydrase/acetyltransferase-like protein (isoleucine patch superfamily)
MAIYLLGAAAPTVDPRAWIAPGAHVIGQVTIAAQCSVWFGAVVRGDNEPIRIGPGSNVQEGAVLHTDPGFPLVIGEGVTVGHQAMLHGCTVGAGCLIGIQAVVMNGATLGRECLVAAGALVTEGKSFPDRSLILGSPAKAVRPLSDGEVAALRNSAEVYVAKAKAYATDLAMTSGTHLAAPVHGQLGAPPGQR